MKEFLKEQLTKLLFKQARQIINKHKPIVVAVVGSIGKTSTKMAIVTVLQQKYRVQFQNGNYNVPLTVPLVVTGQSMPSLLNPFAWLKVWLRGQRYVHGAYPFDVIVLELGADKPGDIIEFKKLAHPDISVVSGISEEHMEFFKTIDAVAKEEFAIAQYSKQLVINADDIDHELVDLYVPDSVPVIKYGFSRGCNYKVTAKRNNHHSFDVSIKTPIGADIENTVMVAAKHSLKPVAAAIAVADILELTHARINKGISHITPSAGRMRLLEGKQDSIIIDDSYNASPLAVEAALHTLYDMQAPRRIAILGSMNELGAVAKTAHEHIGSLCDPNKIDLLITIAHDANEYIASKAEQNGCKVIRTNSPYKAGKVALQNLEKGALVLVKGSQNRVYSEEAIKSLLANPSDVSQLVRQSDFWMQKKTAQFNTEG